MTKYNIAFFLFVFLHSSGYSQTETNPNRDTTTAFPKDTTSKDSAFLVSKNIVAEKTVKYEQVHDVYKLKPAVDIPIVAVGTGWSLYAFTKIYKKDPSTEEEILALKTSDINSFDRGAVRKYDKSLDDVSYYPFYGAMPLPFLFFLTGERTRHDFWKLSFLYWETMSVTGLFGTGATYFVDRYRPYTYSPETPMEKRTAPNAKNSFYAGHVEIVAVSTFFISKVYSDYYPESNAKWLFYLGAAGATGTMAYLRYEAGMHFPTDIALGITMGAAAGILVPHFHKHRLVKDHDLGIYPYKNGETLGFTLIYK